MENCTELTHHGIKGMRWGIRRFQNKDGSLTPAGKKRYGDDDSPGETTEETRARVLKSTNAKEIYENRHLLTTNELNERITRIDTEVRLASKIVEEPKKTGYDYVNSVIKAANKMNEVYETLQKPAYKAAIKAIKKAAGIEDVKEFDLEKQYANINKLTDQQVKDLAVRVRNTQAIKNAYDALKKTADDAKPDDKAKVDDTPETKTDKSDKIKDTKPDDTPKTETTSSKTDSKPNDTPKTHVADESDLKRREQGSTEWKSVSESATKTRATGEDYINKLAGVGQTFRDNDKYAADKAREDYHKKLTSIGTVMTDHDTSAGEQYLKKMYYARGTFVDEEHVKHSEEEMGNDELYHWKYKSKVRVNGKWRYIYDDYSISDKKSDRLKDIAGLDEKARYQEANASYEKAAQSADIARNYYKSNKNLVALAELNKTRNSAVLLDAERSIAKREYLKTPIGVLDTVSKPVVKVGKTLVDKILNKVEDLNNQQKLKKIPQTAQISRYQRLWKKT